MNNLRIKIIYKTQKLSETIVSEIEQSYHTTSSINSSFGARYLDPRTTRWLSVDPAMYQGDYIPGAPINDEVRRNNNNLPGMGGIYNYVNMHVYHYGGNNPVKYVDPNGRNFLLLIWDLGTWGIASIGEADQGIPRSLFSQQFYTSRERQIGERNFLNVISSGTGIFSRAAGFIAAGLSAISQASTIPIDPRLIDYPSAKAFIEGAKNEIERINDILSTLDADVDFGFSNFLRTQLDLLTTELVMNEENDARRSEGIRNSFGYYGAREPYVDRRSTNIGSPLPYYELYEKYNEIIEW